MLALLFPGQASQAVGMGVALRERSAAARHVFDLADQVTGLPITSLTEQGPLERLTETDIAQPAVVATSLAALSVLRDELGDRLSFSAVAGHSVGELSAYVAAGALDEESALRLVHARARAMAAACARVDGTMAAVIGLEDEALRDVCTRATNGSGAVELANLNSPGQLVISGERAAIDRAAELAKAAGARRVLPLNVGGPFHSQYMLPATETLREALSSVSLRAAAIPVVVNVSATEQTAPEALREELAAQVAAPVRWTETLHRLREMGCTRFVEVGPGQVLAGLVKRTLPDARVASFGSPDSLEAAIALVTAA